MRFPGGIDRERWFKWIVSLKGPGVPEETILQPFLSGIVLIGLTGVPSTSNEEASMLWAAAVDGMKAGHQHSSFFTDCQPNAISPLQI